MKKRFLSILMALALALSLLPSAALASETTDGTGGGPETTVADEQTDTITGGEETTTTTGGEVTTTPDGGVETTTPAGTEGTQPTVTPTSDTLTVGGQTFTPVPAGDLETVTVQGVEATTVEDGNVVFTVESMENTSDWKQQVGDGGDPQATYVGVYMDMPDGATWLKTTDDGTLNDPWVGEPGSAFLNGNKYQQWIPIATHDGTSFALASSGRTYTILLIWYNGNGSTDRSSEVVARQYVTITRQVAEDVAVAEVDGKIYGSLADAVEKAANGATIQMQKSTSLDGYIKITKDITLDLNGKTITSDANYRCAFVVGTSGVTFTIDDTAGGGKIVSAITSEGDDGNSNVIEVSDGELIVKGGELVNTWFVVFVRQNGVATIEGGTLRSTVASALSTNGSKAGEENYSGNAVMNVKGGNLISARDVAIYVPAGTLNISGGTITGATAVYSKCGTTTITGGKIQGTGADTGFKHSDGGCFATGDALVIEACAYPNGNPTVRVSGGSFTSTNVSAVGYYEYDGNKAEEISITGGTFSTDPSDYVPVGYVVSASAPYEVTESDDGALVVKPEAPDSNGSVSGTLDGLYQGSGTAVTVDKEDSSGENVPDSSGTINNTGSLVVDLKTPEGTENVTSTTLTVTAEAAQSLAKNNAQSLTLVTDKGSVTLDNNALSKLETVAAPVEITVQATPGVAPDDTLAASYTVSVQSGEQDLLPYGDAANGVIEITVDAPTAHEGDVLQAWYAVEQGDSVIYMENLPMNQEGDQLVIQITHLSRVDVLTAEPTNQGVAMIGTTAYASLKAAIEAVDSPDDVIVLTQNIDTLQELIGETSTTENTLLTVNKDVTIQGNTYSISITLPEDFEDRGQAISVGTISQRDVTLTLDGVDLTITRDTAKTGGGDAFDVWGDLVITNASEVTLNGVQSGFTVQGGASAEITVNNGSTVTANNVKGNFSNGGDWTLTNATLDINGCDSYGLSANDITVENSNVTIDDVAYSGIIVTNIVSEEGVQEAFGGLTVDNSQITISNSGSGLPRSTKWGVADGVIDLGHASGATYYDNGDAVPNAVARLSVLDNSSIILNSNNSQGANFIYLTNTAEMENAPTATLPTIQVEDGMADDTYTVRFMVDSQIYHLSRLKVGGSDTFDFPLDPVKAGWTFTSWTYPTNGTVKGNNTAPGAYYIENAKANTTYDFVAQWSYNVPVTPSDPGSNRPSSSVGSNSEPSYSPVQNVSDGGTIKVSPRTAEEGDEVTITPDPDAGYEVADVTVTRNGRAIEVTENRDGTYTFTQPSGRVTIDVTFQRIGGEPVGFTDVPASFWAADEINWAYENGYVNGTTATTFNPNGTISRQQVWMILARLSGRDPADMAAARTWAMENGVSDGTNPGGAVTRQQLVALLYRFAEDRGYANDSRADLSAYPDAGTVAEYAVEPMRWSVANDIVGGTTAGTLNPEGTATRAQFAVILYRFWSNV